MTKMRVIYVDFAGSPTEAAIFCQEHPKLRLGATIGEYPTICFDYTNEDQRKEGAGLLSSLGWDEDFQAYS